MGNRVTVSISSQEHESPINIYAHWAGDEVYQVVTDTLASSDRIGDASYLSAQIAHAIFTEFGYDGKLGFGIWTGEVTDLGDDNDPMFVDADTGQWRIGNGEMDWQDKDAPLEDVYSCECADCRVEMEVVV